jgi:hypothetical protein
MVLLFGLLWGGRRLHWEKGDKPLVRWAAPGEKESLTTAQKEAGEQGPAPGAESETEPREADLKAMSAEEMLAEGTSAGEGMRGEIEGEPVVVEARDPVVAVVQTEEPQPRTWPTAGSELTLPLVVLLAREKQSFWGYGPNDLVVGKLLDNHASRQEGIISVLQPYIAFIIHSAAPAGNDPALRLQAALLESDLHKYWFTSGETQMNRAIKSLQDLGAGLDSGQIRIAADPGNLGDGLAVLIQALRREREVLLSDPGMMKNDNAFFHAQGAALAVKEALDGLARTFKVPAEQGRILGAL